MRSIVHIRKRWASTLSVAVLGLLLLLPASPHGADVVLCLEESGQVNVERAKAGQCTEGAQAKSESALKILDASEGEHCIDCSDVPLRVNEADDPCVAAVVSSSSELEGPNEQGTPLSAVSAATQVLGTQETPLSSHQHVQSARPNADRDVSLGSVVLLI